MLIYNRIKIGALGLLFAVSSLSSLYAADQPGSQPSPAQLSREDQQALQQLILQKQQEEMLEMMLKKILKHYKQLDLVLEHLAQIVNNSQVKNLNKSDTIDHIKALRSIIATIERDSFVVVNPEGIALMTTLLDTFITYLRSVLNVNLAAFPPLDLASVITRSMKEDVDLEKVEHQLEASEKALEKLEYQAQNVGISRLNKLYRRFLSLNKNYNLVRTTGLTLAAGFFTFYILTKFRATWLDQIPGIKLIPYFKELKENWIGESADANQVTGQISTYNPYTGEVVQDGVGDGDIKAYASSAAITLAVFHQLGFIDLKLKEPWITLESIFSPFASEWERFKVWSLKKIEATHNFLYGGKPIKTIESYDRKSKVRFKDIIGKEGLKQVFARVIDYIRDPEPMDRAGIQPEAGYLCYGKTRAGKSYFIEGVAGELDDIFSSMGITDKFHYLVYNAADVKQLEVWRIARIAKSMAPCILVIEEIDLLDAQRHKDSKVLSELLTEMSSCLNKDISKTVIWIGITNKPDQLDHALLQKGRYGKLCFFDYPTPEERFEFLKRELDNRSIISIDPDYLRKLAQEAERCSFEELKSVLMTALHYAKLANEPLSQEHLEHAFNEEIRQIIFDDIKLTDNEKHLIAVHQAGHALASMLLKPNDTLLHATIRPVSAKIQENQLWYIPTDGLHNAAQTPIEYGKLFTARENKTLNLDTREELIKQIKVHVAGHIAETIILDSCAYSQHVNDRKDALAIAKQITFKGMNPTLLHKDLVKKYSLEADELMMHCEDEIKLLLTEHKESLLAISQALEKELTLSADEMKKIITNSQNPSGK